MTERRRPFRWTDIPGFLVLALLSPFLEKNPQKLLAVRAPVVFSMTRIVIFAFSVAMYAQIRGAGIAGWPEATLCIALVFSNHIAAALEKLPSRDVIAFGREIISRFGVGGVRSVGSVYPPLETTPERLPDDTRDP